MPRADRLLQLMQLLRRHRSPVSAAILAEELGVSLRSVYRDVQTLRGQGATIEGEAGVGYLLRPGFLLPPLMFSDEELEALVLGLRLTVEHGDEVLRRAATDVMAKVRSVLPSDLRRMADEIALLAGPAPARPPELIELSLIRRTIRAHRKALISYTDERGKRTIRTVWPIGLAYFERARLVVSWCETRNDFRSFRADRIGSWEAQTAPIPRPRGSLLKEWRDRERIPAQVPG